MITGDGRDPESGIPPSARRHGNELSRRFCRIEATPEAVGVVYLQIDAHPRSHGNATASLPAAPSPSLPGTPRSLTLLGVVVLEMGCDPVVGRVSYDGSKEAGHSPRDGPWVEGARQGVTGVTVERLGHRQHQHVVHQPAIEIQS